MTLTMRLSVVDLGSFKMTLTIKSPAGSGSQILGSKVVLGLPPSQRNYNTKKGLSRLTIRSTTSEGHGHVTHPTPNTNCRVTRTDFPPDFKFGCATSALQTEGAGDEGGRGPSTWDDFIQDGIGDKDIAIDSHRRYKEDVQLLKKMGVDTYRFSISWSRILPDGTISGGINQEGINFYNSLIDDLIHNGITPFVTLFHFDLPTALQSKYKGFLSRQIVDDFEAYADLCFEKFGDKVKHWATVNEPQIYGLYGYQIGMTYPEANPATDPYLATHHILLAHASAAKLYKQKYQASQGGEIGIPLVVEWFEPYQNTPQDKNAAQRAFDFLVGWFMEPLVYGDYPFVMKALVRDGLPEFSEEEKVLVKGSYDYIGINYYTSRFAATLPISNDDVYTSPDQHQHVELTVNDSSGNPIGPSTPGSSQIYVYPPGLRDALVFMKHYNNPKFYITENGYPDKRDDAVPVETALQDDARIQHILSHLDAVSEAMKKGANVKGYLMWALLDCMEMGSGYQVRFGLNYTDYLNNLNRIPKKSAAWLQSFLGSPPS